MIAHMRAEALKRGKDWLRSKIEDKGDEVQEHRLEQPAPLIETVNAEATEQITPPQQRESKRQRAENKPARKPTKKSKVEVQIIGDGTPATPEAIRPRALAEANAYPNKQDAATLVKGFEEGFIIPVKGQITGGSHKNLKSALEQPEVVQQKIYKESKLGCIEGPLAGPLPLDLIISPLGVVPKKEPGQFRLIHHLSFPEGTSVNDNIPEEACAVGYATLDDAIDIIKTAGKDTLLAKADIESAFQLLPVHPDSYHLLGFQHNGQVFMDKAMPMGYAIPCAYFELFSTFLEWALHKKHPSGVKMHYLDDFLFIGGADDGFCASLLSAFQALSEELGVLLAKEKTVGPSTSLTFLGIELDSATGTSRLPAEKWQT
ncbi:hypothetical protein NDU88_003814 [Pleurodeles waltl]|uniref:ribonuclease H n=1 Tax=Pleurodeles waltl TaxID=8319 RepID=A0AAV7RGW9_PLEWA|nr:hypothetical protein NDU88_003814 [Pleurodeles waltl]